MKSGDSSVYWVIDFKKGDTERQQADTESAGIPPFDLYIPQDTTQPPKPRKRKSKYKALEFLQEIKDSCESLREECNETLAKEKQEPYEEQISHITEDIKGLFGIIQEFTELIQKLQPPPEDPDQQDEKNS